MKPNERSKGGIQTKGHEKMLQDSLISPTLVSRISRSLVLLLCRIRKRNRRKRRQLIEEETLSREARL